MKKAKRKKGRGHNQHHPYPFELQLRVVRMYQEEEYQVSMICKETGVGRPPSIKRWMSMDWVKFSGG